MLMSVCLYDEVSQAQLERVHPHLVSNFVHQRLDREARGRTSGRAHVTSGTSVRVHP